MSNMQCVIFDIDGTLADIGHRLHYVKGEKKDFDAFNDACDKDTPKQNIVELAKILSLSYEIIFVTGREDKYRKKTVLWLDKHVTPWPLVFMRSTGDYRPDDVIKEEFLAEILKRYDVKLVVDDRDKVVEMWRRNGLTCLQCQKGDY